MTEMLISRKNRTGVHHKFDAPGHPRALNIGGLWTGKKWTGLTVFRSALLQLAIAIKFRKRKQN
jgi:hypothetical protein